MKYIIKIQNIPILLFVVLLFGCQKNNLSLTEYTLPTDKGFVRLAFFSPTSPATTVMVKANDIKLNGAFTSTNAGFFPSTLTNSDYAAVDPNANFKLSIPNTSTLNDSIVLYNGNFGGIEQNKFYTLVLADTGVNRTGFKFSDDEAQFADSGFINVRFINAVPNAPINIIRIDSTSATNFLRDTIARNLTFKSASAFLKTSLQSRVTPSATIRFRAVTVAGGSVPAGVVIGTTAPTLSNRRAVTIFAAGFAAGTGTWVSSFGNLMTNK